MAIKIKQYDSNHQLLRTLESIGRTDDFEIEPDNRMELVQTINGAIVTDGGYYSDGDKYVLSAVFDDTTYGYLKTIWETRSRVDVVFEDNTTVTNAVIVIRGISYFDKLLNTYKKVRMEVWKAGGLT